MPGVGSRRSDYSTFSARAVCGMSTAFLIFAIGIACLVVSFIGFSEQDAIECGQGGKPSLIIWVWATGVAFFVISCAYFRVSSGKGGKLAKWILGGINLFFAVWAIVGIVSMTKYDGDCKEENPTVWNMAWAVVCVSFLLCCCGGIVGYRVHTKDAEVVARDIVADAA